MNRRDKAVSGIDLRTRVGMEIGPLARPFVTKAEGEIVYVDYLDGPALREKWRNDPNVDVSQIVDVDLVWNQIPLLEAVGEKRFDYIVASHVIEHVPDLISWLESLAQVLKPDGEVRLVVPDRRFTFDYLRQESRVSDIVDAYLRKAKVPLSHSVLDDCCYHADVDPVVAWRGEVDVTRLKKLHTPEGALHVARDALENGVYHDVHCWTFTPRSFTALFEQLGKLGFLRFTCGGLHDTERNEFDFFVTLRVCNDKQGVIDSWKEAQQRSFVEIDTDLRAQQIQTIEQRVTELQAKLEALTASASWRWTAPLRRIHKLLATKR